MQTSHLDLSDTTSATRIPPPLLVLGAIGVGALLDGLVGMRQPPAKLLRIIGHTTTIAGGSLIGSAFIAMVRSGNSPDPRTPVQQLNQNGVFQWSRNPIYLGMLLNQLGVGLARRSAVTIALLPVTMAILRWKVIEGEETYLASRFGDEYREYRDRVPRWFGIRSH
ncbi:isoprenylcysteine carboxylmethyltransferase family protein [Ferrimicrobium sp.]|uniref:methyltransferase family protein n=1 Tax=Ferrimicrobium sp. TaxID=2926050 RepID=UPI0026026AFC|nr:isoprenylcysteine carboxylmethyltransferase family protein [Ferrimicrobium sp.]